MRKKIAMLCMQACILFSLGAGSTAVYADVPFIGEVRWFAGNFAPRGWALCDGQLLPISQNEALFSILGTTYGGDGETTFGLPDLRGRGMVHVGSGPGLTPRPQGQKGGSESDSLNQNQMAAHSHTLRANVTPGDSVLPHDRAIARVGRLRVYDETADADMGASSITTEGGDAHNTMQPHIALNCIIALEGLYPSRN